MGGGSREAVNAVVEAAPEDGAVEGEAIFLGYAARGKILGTDQRNDMTAAKGGKGIVTDSARRFSGIPPVSVTAVDVVADFELGRAVDCLPYRAAVADELTGFPEDEAEQAGAGGIMGDLAGDPLLDLGEREAAWIPAHSFLVAEDGVKSGSVVRGHLAQDEARGFEGHHD